MSLDGTLQFLKVPPPRPLGLEEVTFSIAEAVRRLLIRRGRLTHGGELCPPIPLERIWQASAKGRMKPGGDNDSCRRIIWSDASPRASSMKPGGP